MEDLWEKGEAGVDIDSFSHSPMVIESDHFQCLFLIMGILHSLGLTVLLWDILANRKLNFYEIMTYGLCACFFVTTGNLFFFSTTLWTMITYDTEERKDRWGAIATPARTISSGEYEFNMEILENNKIVAFAIIGFGAVSSSIFIFVAMIRSLGKG